MRGRIDPDTVKSTCLFDKKAIRFSHYFCHFMHKPQGSRYSHGRPLPRSSKPKSRSVHPSTPRIGPLTKEEDRTMKDFAGGVSKKTGKKLKEGDAYKTMGGGYGLKPGISKPVTTAPTKEEDVAMTKYMGAMSKKTGKKFTFGDVQKASGGGYIYSYKGAKKLRPK